MEYSSRVEGIKGNLYNHLEDGTTELFTSKNERIIIDTGDFDKVRDYTWRTDNRGSVLTSKTNQGRKIPIYMPRLLLANRDIEGKAVNYINGDRLDNRKSNLSCGNIYNHLEDGTTELFTHKNERVLIDTEDFEKARQYTWWVNTKRSVITSKINQGKITTIYLPKLLLDNIKLEDNVVNYLNGDRLDNRKSNISCEKIYNHLEDGATELFTSKNERILVDTEDFEKVKGYTWWINHRGIVVTHNTHQGQHTTLYMSKVVLGDRYIARKTATYLNGDSLDNRKSNISCGLVYNHLEDDITELFTSKNERILIDTEDFEKVRDYTWGITNGRTVVTQKKSQGKYMNVTMTRVILADVGDTRVMHINGNSLDNRKSNLRYGNNYNNLGDGTTEIHTSNNERILIDTEDFELVRDYVWWVDKSGYALAEIDSKKVKMHRFIMERYEDIDGLVIDHIEHNTIDNRKEKLRVCTNSQNCMNQVTRSNNTTGVAGIRQDKRSGKYEARIQVDGVRIHLGTYENFEEAVKVRKEAELKYFGEYSYDNSTKNVKNKETDKKTTKKNFASIIAPYK